MLPTDAAVAALPCSGRVRGYQAGCPRPESSSRMSRRGTTTSPIGACFIRRFQSNTVSLTLSAAAAAGPSRGKVKASFQRGDVVCLMDLVTTVVLPTVIWQ